MNSFIRYKNKEVHFTVKGKGSAVVLLHGFLEDLSMWQFIVPEIVKNHKVICIDLLGHGKTGCLGYVHTMEEMAEMVMAVLKNERIRKATFIGHSMGGYVGLAFLEKYSDNVKGLCLMNSSAQADTPERQDLRLRAIKMVRKNYEVLVSMSVNNLFVQEGRDDIREEIEFSKKIALSTSAQGYVACTEGMRIRKNREVFLTSLEVKKMIVLGKQDPVLNSESIIKEGLKTNTKVIQLSKGHMSHIENPKELAIAIALFLKEK